MRSYILIGDLIADSIEKAGDDVLIRISVCCLLSLCNRFLFLFAINMFPIGFPSSSFEFSFLAVE